MSNSKQDNLTKALQVITSTIYKCEKIQPKFKIGNSQHTLLQNRIKALYISKSLLLMNGTAQEYSITDLEKALPPIISIINKTKKAQSKYEKGSVQYNRYEPIIKAMQISQLRLEEELINRK